MELKSKAVFLQESVEEDSTPSLLQLFEDAYIPWLLDT